MLNMESAFVVSLLVYISSVTAISIHANLKSQPNFY
jgi:hypothetical protein